MNGASFGKGAALTAFAFFLWGIFPLYWRLLSAVAAFHILALRILLSLVLVSVILLAQKNVSWIALFKSPKNAVMTILAGLILSCNWGVYIWAVNTGHTIEASLGYYINPLVSIVLGLTFFRETLRPLQWIAVGIAFVGVLILTVLQGGLPWISLALALTFGFYSLLKKMIMLPALESLGAETLAAAPFGIFLLCFNFNISQDSPAVLTLSSFQHLAYLAAVPAHVLILLALSGAATMLPLYLFSQGAKLIPLSTIGFTQFLSPTLQFIIGLFIFGESFPLQYFIAFVFIWSAGILYIVSLRSAATENQRSSS